MLQRFEDIHPGFTDRMLKNAEVEGAHKRDLDRSLIAGYKTKSILGMCFAFATVLAISGVAVYALYMGFPVAAAGIMTACIASAILAFINQRKEAKEKE
jgi:uncharacterized membrane protein